MNPEVLELVRSQLASQLGLDAEQSARLAAGDISVALQVMAGSDPVARAVASAMSASFASSERTQPRSRGSSERDLASTDTQQLRARVRSLEQRLAAAEEVLGAVAEILGACACFGLEANCADCNGQGVPGTNPSADTQVFLSWVEGGLRHLGLPLHPDTATNQQPTDTGTLHG